MTASNKDQAFEQLAQKIAPQSRLTRVWQLEGGVSAQVTVIEIERPDGQSQKLLVRRHGAADLKRNPNIAADEFKLLQMLQSAGLATPMPYYLDQSGEIFATPYIVIEYIEGKPEFAPSNLTDFIHQLGAHLSTIHSIDCTNLDLSFLPKQQEVFAEILRERSSNLDESLDEGCVRNTLHAVWPIPQDNESVLLHGDFWPGNTLWKDGQLVAVIDWEDAAIGDPLADVANARLEVLWAFGVDAMHSFTHHYRSMTAINFTNLSYWDLVAAVRQVPRIGTWGLDNATEQAMREGLKVFITQAFAALLD
jgi:aminoglycoside phosphotransferase (APT) family kinase protein